MLEYSNSSNCTILWLIYFHQVPAADSVGREKANADAFFDALLVVATPFFKKGIRPY